MYIMFSMIYLDIIECSLGDMLLIYTSFSKLTFPSLFFQHVVYITEIQKVPRSAWNWKQTNTYKEPDRTTTTTKRLIKLNRENAFSNVFHEITKHHEFQKHYEESIIYLYK